ncbi:hypothetical protein WDU94_013437 [Cyamophila willieti]
MIVIWCLRIVLRTTRRTRRFTSLVISSRACSTSCVKSDICFTLKRICHRIRNSPSGGKSKLIVNIESVSGQNFRLVNLRSRVRTPAETIRL